jgi:hypothetical protein
VSVSQDSFRRVAHRHIPGRFRLYESFRLSYVGVSFFSGLRAPLTLKIDRKSAGNPGLDMADKADKNTSVGLH